MKFNIGDKVRFLNEVGGGKVVKYVNDETVMVLTDDDFEIPVLADELIIDKVYNYENTNNSNNIDSKKSVKDVIIEDDYEKDTDNIEIFLALVNDNNIANLFLINDSNYQCFANVALKYGAYYISYAHTLTANTKIEIRKLTKTDINSIDSIQVQMIFYKEKAYKLKPILSETVKVSLLRDKKLVDNDFFDKRAVIIPVFNENDTKQATFPEISAEEIKRAMQTKEYDNTKLNKKPESKSSKPKEVREVDLHIHQLLDKHENMTPKEIIDYQMDCFRKELKQAVDDHVKQIVFIHGKGNGSLKSELRRELKHQYRKYQFQDASFQKYGFGATMVYLHR